MFKTIAAAIVAIALAGMAGCGSAPGPRYQDVASFSEGLAGVKAANGRWGFINKNNVMVIAPRFEEVKEFKDGKAAAKMNGRWGFINKRGEWQ